MATTCRTVAAAGFSTGPQLCSRGGVQHQVMGLACIAASLGCTGGQYRLVQHMRRMEDVCMARVWLVHGRQVLRIVEQYVAGGVL
jgi:hypothetical protein